MAVFGNKRGNRGDSAVTIFAIFAMLLAGGISIATISTDKNTDTGIPVNVMDIDPLARAEQAAAAGVKAVQGHIECHGITESGGLPDQYYANGARFNATWDEINLADSTVKIITKGYCVNENGMEYSTTFESVIKVNLLATHNQAILQDYYNSGYEKASANSAN